MDVNPSITLHPQAKDFLFEHYRTVKRIFSDVIGLLEIDYLAIALINPKNELFFLSSHPSIECNLIEHNLWQLDKSYHDKFIQQDQAQYWEELYPKTKENRLRHYKLEAQKFSIGIAIPARFAEYRVVYSFALKTSDKVTKSRLLTNLDTLINMGQFCLRNIIKTIPLPEKQQTFIAHKPTLKLIINNQVNYENNT
ncbi:flagellar biosynthesis protein FlgJ [Legionella cardiaca]|uniref:Flagellar biosynthesis protein FlgJ n=1 Tax=Legionella cardiaca TaxID=1071983 RepID=A0ABY8AVP8_9GAMM|nr:flagellar biosynthesis protein FlgJ [Legionella cardiaca]WED43242.1 flagellar biosynthesis protein FlgJ [Legionella cardiaca]